MKEEKAKVQARLTVWGMDEWSEAGHKQFAAWLWQKVEELTHTGDRYSRQYTATLRYTPKTAQPPVARPVAEKKRTKQERVRALLGDKPAKRRAPRKKGA